MKLIRCFSLAGLLIAFHAIQGATQEDTANPVVGDSIPPRKNVGEIKFKESKFTFVRIKYNVSEKSEIPKHDKFRLHCFIDYPEADLGLTMRVQEQLGIDVDPQGKVLSLTDPNLKHYPFTYIVEPSNAQFSQEEAKALRKNLMEGGFLMADDFWGEEEWEQFYKQIKKAFPDREPQEIRLNHPVFQCFYQLNEKPQVPNVGRGIQSQFDGITWERHDAREPHYRGLFDNYGRLMAIFCHNTDLGDGWEQCEKSQYFQKEFCEKRATPMSLNIVVYALTH